MQEYAGPVKTVLVAEDYADSRFMLGRLLEMTGYRVVEAADGREAVAVAEQECPDIVLMDLQMPVMDGLTATSLIRRIDGICRVPIIAVSAQDTEDFINEAARAGCDRFFPKPVDFDLLLELIRECTGVAEARTLAAPPNDVTDRRHCV